jgi:WD40 repeat protein
VGEIFISYATADRALAGPVAAGMRRAGHGVFLDSDPEDGIAPGAAWRRTLFRELRICDAVVFLNSLAAQDSRWCHAELLVAAELGKRVYPLDLSPGLALHPLLESVQGITFGIELGDSVRRLTDRLELDGLAGAGRLRWVRGRPPYPGLAAMDVADAGVFFGRDDDVQRLRDRVDRPLGQRDGDLVIVMGPSGAGKSSLVRAGLAARLAVPGAGWAVTAPFEPGIGPLDRLATALAALLPELTVEDCRGRLAREGLAAFGEWLADRTGSTGAAARRLLITVDQAEQLVTVSSAAERESFLGVLGGALRPGSPVTVVMTARSDRLDEIQQLPEIGTAIRDPFVIAPLNRSRLAQVIEGPASRADLTFEPGLTGRLVVDAARGPGETADALPLLAFVLREMYDQLVREDRTVFTGDDYERVGRIDGVIDRRARAAEEALPPGSDDVLDRMLTRFVALDGERLPVARPVPRGRLTAAERDIAKSLEDQRLLAGTGAGAGAGEDPRPVAGAADTIRLAHERLIVAWPRLARVVADHRDDLLMQTRLERQTVDWKEGHGALLSQEATEEARAWQTRSGTSDADIVKYIAASKADLRRRRGRRIGILAILTALTLIASVIAVWAGIQRSNAVAQSRLAQSETRTAQSEALAAEAANLQAVNGPLSMLLSLQAYERAATLEARSAVIQAGQQLLDRLLQASVSPIRDVAFSRDKHTLAVADDEGRITLWNFTTGEQLTPKPLTQGGGTIWSLAFTPDGRTLAAGDGVGNIGLWNVATGKEETPKPLNEGSRVWSLAFSRDGRTLAAGDDHGRIRLWDWAKQTRTADLNEGEPVQSVAFSPDGRTLAVGSAGYITAWDVKARKWTHSDHISDSTVWSVAFSPDGRTVAAGDWAGHVFLWDALTGKETGILTEGSVEDTVWGVAFSRDGRTLAVGDGYGNVGLWDVATKTPTRTLAVGSQVLTVEFSKDGSTLAVGDDVGNVSLWDGAAGQRHPAMLTEDSTTWDVALSPDGRTLADSSDTIVLRDTTTGKQTGKLDESANSIAFSKDGSRLVAGDGDGNVIVWNVAAKKKAEELKDSGSVYGVAFSPDGRSVAAAGDYGSDVIVWNTVTNQRIALPDDKQRVYSVAFSPKGDILAAGDIKGHVLLWNTANAKPIADLNEGTTVWSVAFSPDGRTLAVGDFTGHIGLWSVVSGKWRRVRTLAVGTEVRSVAFSPDAPATLVSGDTLGNVSVWNTTTGQELASLLEADRGAIGLAFPENGRMLAIAGMDGEIALLRQDLKDLSQQDFMRLICGKVHANMTQAQWGKYAPGQPYQRTCP